ncbi:MAG: hypothetical protein M1834_000790 [Cirrosporium novae-zelandiae]|nr:MAG: hypothetical protein M1834_000790 [Cirrosporium novae-zelandiae]
MANGASDTKAMNRETFCRLFRAIIRNAGYYENITIHTLRRGLANKVNKVATESERSQILTHKDPNLFGNEYIAHLSSVDAQAIFVDGVPNTEHIKHLQSVGKYRQIGLPCHLPAERKAALSQDPDLLDLRRQLQQLVEKNSDKCVISTAKKQLFVYQSRLEPEALKQYRQKWIRTRLEREVLSFTTGPPDDFVNTDFVEDLYLLMPERKRLAMTINSEKRLSSEEKLQTTQDLLSLCVRNFDVIYRPGEQPSQGTCPVNGCGLSLDRIARSRRSSHIHSCRRREFAVVHGCPECELHYCFQCFQWYHEENQWEAHCREHLSSTITRRCEVSTYCHTLIRPAYCPICLGDENIPAASRMKSWTRSGDLWKHLNQHLQTIQSRWPASCPHPRCDCQVVDEQSFRYHLSDVHGLRQRWGAQQHEPKQDETTPASIPEEIFDHAPVEPTRKRKRREKPSSENSAPDSELPKPRRSRRIALMLNKKNMSSASSSSSVDQSHNPGPRPSLATMTESGFSETMPYYPDNFTTLSYTPTPDIVSSMSESCSSIENDIQSIPGSPSMAESPLTDISMDSIPIDPRLLLEFKE